MHAHPPPICLRCLRSQQHAPGYLRRGVRLASSSAAGPSSEAPSAAPFSAGIKREARRTSISRNHGKGRLPLPPIMDPIAVAAKERWSEPKPRPNAADRTPFQQKLYKSAFAHALAAPVRQCNITYARVPDHFCLELRPALNPTTQEPWLLPTGAHAESKASADPSRHIPAARCLLRHDLVHYIRNQRRWAAIKGPRMEAKLNHTLGSNAAKKLVWREDMADFVGKVLGDVVVRKLKWFLNLAPKNGIREGIEELDEVEDVAAVLFFRPLTSYKLEDAVRRTRTAVASGDYVVKGVDQLLMDRERVLEIGVEIPMHRRLRPVIPKLQNHLVYPPLEYPTIRWRGRDVSVYGLAELLGKETCEKLLTGSKLEGAGCAVLKLDYTTTALGQALAQLQNYYAEPKV